MRTPFPYSKVNVYVQGNRKSGMTADEAALHQDLALKMRKALGEDLHDAQPGEDSDAQQRRLNLIRQCPGATETRGGVGTGLSNRRRGGVGNDHVDCSRCGVEKAGGCWVQK